MGVSHPTGTPLYLLLIRGWEFLCPLGTVVFKINLMNVILSSINILLFVYLIYCVTRFYSIKPIEGLLISALSASSLSFSKTYWYESLSASPYMLHFLFFILWLYFLMRYILAEKERYLMYAFLMVGIALANHVLSLIMICFSLIYSFTLWMKGKIRLRTFFSLMLFFVPGLALYLYVPIRASAKPIVNWGNPDSFKRFLRYILRKEYYVNSYVETFSDFMEVVYFHTKSFLLELYPLILIPCFLFFIRVLAMRAWSKKEGGKSSVIGKELVHARSGEKKSLWKLPTMDLLGLGIVVMILNLAFVGIHGSHLDIFFLKHYMLSGYIGLFVSLMVMGIHTYAKTGRAIRYLFILFLAFMPVMGLVTNFHENDRSKNVLVKSYVDLLFLHLPPGAIFFAEGDNHLFSTMYYHLVEKKRPDIRLVNPHIGLGEKSISPSLVKSGKLFTSHYKQTEKPVRVVPAGLVYRVTCEEHLPVSELDWKNFTDEEIGLARSPFEKILLTEYYRRKAVYHEMRHETGPRLNAIKAMERVGRGFDRTLMLTGREFGRIGMVGKALELFQRSLAINPKNRAARMYLNKYGSAKQ
jgi:hypothetical protein